MKKGKTAAPATRNSIRLTTTNTEKIRMTRLMEETDIQSRAELRSEFRKYIGVTDAESDEEVYDGARFVDGKRVRPRTKPPCNKAISRYSIWSLFTLGAPLHPG